MASNSDASITLKARTDEFNERLNKAAASFESLASKGRDVGASLDNSFKKITIVAKNSAFQIEKSFNALSIKSDLTLDVQAKALEKNVKFFEQQYQKIAKNANTSAAEAARAFTAMNDKIRQLNEQPLSSSFKTLSILPTSKVEAEKAKIISAFEEIKRVGTQNPEDITRAYEVMVSELNRLDQLLLTSAEKSHAEALEINKQFNSQRIASEREYVLSVEEAYRINDRLIKEAAAKEIALQREVYLAREEANAKQIAMDREVYLAHEQAIAKNIALEREYILAREEAYAIQKRLNDENIARQNAARQEPYKVLGITSSADIEAQKAKAIRSYAQIEAAAIKAGKSDVNSTNDVIRAKKALNLELERLKQLGSLNPVEKTTKGFNAMSLASVAAIAKIQVLYSLINTLMSAIGAIPRVAMDAVESFNASVIGNAAMITSMQTGVKDIGAAYKENTQYAKAVNEELIKMDANTAASFKNLVDMNNKFQQQGVLIDLNNQKQKDGFLAVANALAVMTKGSSNPAQQFPQEISALLRGENKTSNLLFQTLNNFDNGQLKKHIEEWRRLGAEQNNSGLILEKLKGMLEGFTEAQKDINNLWETQKSTLENIRDKILRDGFGPEFQLIINKMKEINEYGTKNEDAIAKMLAGGFENINHVIETIYKYRDGISAVTKALIVVKGAQLAVNLLVKTNPYVLAATFITSFVIHVYQKMEDYKKSIAGAMSITETFAQSLRGLNAVLNNQISLKQYALSSESELKKLLQETAGTGKINSSIDELKLKLKEVRSEWAFNSTDRKAKEERIASIKDQINALEKQKLALINYQSASASSERANELLREKNRIGVVKAPPPPKVNGNTGENEESEADKKAVEKAERAAQRELRLKTNLREKLAALNKSYNEIQLLANENARNLDLQNTENNYNSKIISLSDYVAKKQAIEIAGIKEEIQLNKDTVEEYKKVLEGKFASGTKGAIDKAEAQIKLNSATKELQKSEAQLGLTLSKNNGEYSKFKADYTKKAYDSLGSYTKEIYDSMRKEALQERDDFIKFQGDKVVAERLFRDSMRDIELSDPNVSWITAMKIGLNDVAIEAEGVGFTIADSISGAFNSTADAVAEFAATGKMNFREFTASVLADMSKMIIKQQALSFMASAVKFVGTAVSSYFAPSTSVSAVDTSKYSLPLNAQGGTFSGPGISAYSNTIVSSPTIFPFEQGIGLMGEKTGSSEAILPLTRMPGGDLGVKAQASGGSVTVVNHINIDKGAGGSDTDKANMASQIARAIDDSMKEFVVKEQRYGGLLYKRAA